MGNGLAGAVHGFFTAAGFQCAGELLAHKQRANVLSRCFGELNCSSTNTGSTAPDEDCFASRLRVETGKLHLERRIAKQSPPSGSDREGQNSSLLKREALRDLGGTVGSNQCILLESAVCIVLAGE
ncbi:hypothetical protein HG531_000720 [Fusarium graminearum]|nr:hypothetical protein HG531_000720 [Fusarium graminearum]